MFRGCVFAALPLQHLREVLVDRRFGCQPESAVGFFADRSGALFHCCEELEIDDRDGCSTPVAGFMALNAAARLLDSSVSGPVLKVCMMNVQMQNNRHDLINKSLRASIRLRS